jgi:cell division septation protein DedD
MAHARHRLCRMTHRARRYAAWCACLTLVFSLCVSSPVQAQAKPTSQDSDATPQSYDTLLDDAVAAFDASDFSRARTLFEQAFALRPNARVLRGMGIAALRLERYSEAYRTLTSSLKHPALPLNTTQKEEVTGLLSWMETSLGCIRLRWTPSEPSDYELLVDGNVMRESTLWLSPGTHHVAVHAPGFGAVERTLTLAPEQHEVIEVTLSKRSAPAPIAKAKTKPEPAVSPVDAAHSLSRRPETAAPTTPVPAAHSSSKAARDDGDGGVLTRWWFWTAIAAVAAGGVATAVLLSMPAPRNAPDTSSGSLLVTLPEE